ncbi:MAG: GNAT family N-acetyltransferase, partial [Cyclobacteriaceae bacterium]|nr:GNAT family N-acetyltransferase [Cyclobacteriaceae bacterium]
MIGELKFQISDLAKNSDPPWDLLLLADPSKEMIDRYLSESEVFVGELQGKLIGVLVLLPLSDGIVEIKNLAVDETFQGKG